MQLIVTTNKGCVDDTSRMVTVNPKPMANFGASTVCFGGTTPFKDSSTVSSGSITSWDWNFGDGGNDTVKDPIHQYNSLTTFNVQLIVTTDNGCTDTLPKNINVYQKSFAAFSADTVCSGFPTQFIDTSNAPGDNIANWIWSFGDGDSSKAQNPNPQHLYQGAGTYIVYLVATTDSGCIDTTFVKTVKVNPNPVTTISQLIHTTLGECDGIAEIIPGGGTRPYTFAWDSSGVTIRTDSLALNLCPDTFIVTTTDANGCFRIDTVIIPDGCGLKCDSIYHGISPNADEINDTWVIINIANCIPNKVTIYNRWGDLVWKGKDYDNEAVIWDGFNKNGRRLPDGTYFYIIEVDNERTCQGWVQIMR